MTPKEKAIEIYENMHYYICSSNGLGENDSTAVSAKQCALIAVEEIISNTVYIYYKALYDSIGVLEDYITYQYWQQVKEEISKL